MNTPHLTVNKNLAVLARMLAQLEHSERPVDAEQYRTLARRLADEMRGLSRDAGLDAVLQAYPAAAELYENLNYRHAGLCRSPLEPALAAELAARKAIESLRAAR